MKRFTCSCSHEIELFFESTTCLNCGRLAGFSHDAQAVTTFDKTDIKNLWRNSENGELYFQCTNYKNYGACNGMVRKDDKSYTHNDELCFSCHFNKTIPDLSVSAHLPLWKKLETAKRRTIFTLSALNLSLQDAQQNSDGGLSFEFITDRNVDDHFQSRLDRHEAVFTGHDSGNIVINIAEADEVARTNVKSGLNEKYRTLLGHCRHEIGHYFWDRLIAPRKDKLESYRAIFGDERADYQAALTRHYENGPPSDWPKSFVSSYATMHPWEDWAETWAHYMHMVDTLETAQAYGFDVTRAPCGGSKGKDLVAVKDLDLPLDTPYTPFWKFWSAKETSIDSIIDAWMSFSVGLNALNRSMGLEDAYPFVLTDPIRNKLSFVHTLLQEMDLSRCE